MVQYRDSAPLMSYANENRNEVKRNPKKQNLHKDFMDKTMGGHHRQKYKHNKRFIINRNGVIVLCWTVYLVWNWCI